MPACLALVRHALAIVPLGTHMPACPTSDQRAYFHLYLFIFIYFFIHIFIFIQLYSLAGICQPVQPATRGHILIYIYFFIYFFIYISIFIHLYCFTIYIYGSIFIQLYSLARTCQPVQPSTRRHIFIDIY